MGKCMFISKIFGQKVLTHIQLRDMYCTNKVKCVFSNVSELIHQDPPRWPLKSYRCPVSYEALGERGRHPHPEVELASRFFHHFWVAAHQMILRDI